MSDAARFSRVLVANRGEIAVRVLRAARAAGLSTVAVYSDADRSAPHVREADTAVRIGPPPAAESYLDIAALLGAADRTGAEAVHPGYGFLSERAAFARAVTESGRTFIGPPAEVIELMGRKDRARKAALAADVPVVPAVEGADLIDRAVAEVGLPLLVKAAAGGGGKGMRIVRDPAELSAALDAARREAQSAFGDDTMVIERFVERGRHVEVQVLADEHGHAVHLFERDCSVQRRHQKVLEEAPAPTISAAVRRTLTEAALRLTRQVGYVNAGTVEFLVSGDEIFFLEMNTRLQVEHPVTEAVTGLDLVALQLLVAQGEALPLDQADIELAGSAIEARVYAEDPYAGFLPQAGTASTVRWPATARVDAALDSGQQVTTWYDPMLAKLVVHGPTRKAARRNLLTAIDDTAIFGLTTNLGFLRQLVASEAYRDAAIDTGWLDRDGPPGRPQPAEVAVCIAAWVLGCQPSGGEADDPFAAGDGWRAGGPPAPVRVELHSDAETRVLFVDQPAGTVRFGARSWKVRPVFASPEGVLLEIDGEVHRALLELHEHGVTVGYQGEPYHFGRPEAIAATTPSSAGSGTIVAAMPGTLLSVSTELGRRVISGDTLAVMEAMKMELTVAAPYDGIVTEVNAHAGDRVALGQRLFVVSADQEA
jgi:acetyl-CoA/propionyl-CoA carboxylase, biotin carboxylase, biotin carboxyl carrier protein